MNTKNVYVLGNRVIHGGHVHEANDTLIVETPAEQWRYAVEFPLFRVVCDDGGIRVKVGIHVEQGCLGVGILSRDGSVFRHEMLLSSTERQNYELEFLINAICEIGSLIIRNASGIGFPSRGAVRSLTIEPLFNAKSFAQYSEDLILMGALCTVERGFYIDIGAMDPIQKSVTKMFYEKGWSGINIEPCRRSFDLLVAQRPRDINLWLAASSRRGSVVLHEIVGTGLSTTIEKHFRDYISRGLPHRDYSVPCRPLADICAEYAFSDIHFLKIDVEGAEKSVLEGADFNRFRPWLLAIEATVPDTTTPCHEDWEYLLLAAGYDFALSHQINRYYVAREHRRLKPFIQPKALIQSTACKSFG